MQRISAAILALAAALAAAPIRAASDAPRLLADIARDIAALKRTFPQLAHFDPKVYAGATSISYSFHTHEPARSGGWTSGVPAPDDDGMWFYIDMHDPDSTAQIHTQPMTAPLCLGALRVSFLIQEGARTRPLSAEISRILQQHGAGGCRKHRPSGRVAREIA